MTNINTYINFLDEEKNLKKEYEDKLYKLKKENKDIEDVLLIYLQQVSKNQISIESFFKSNINLTLENSFAVITYQTRFGEDASRYFSRGYNGLVSYYDKNRHLECINNTKEYLNGKSKYINAVEQLGWNKDTSIAYYLDDVNYSSSHTEKRIIIKSGSIYNILNSDILFGDGLDHNNFKIVKNTENTIVIEYEFKRISNVTNDVFGGSIISLMLDKNDIETYIENYNKAKNKPYLIKSKIPNPCAVGFGPIS